MTRLFHLVLLCALCGCITSPVPKPLPVQTNAVATANTSAILAPPMPPGVTARTATPAVQIITVPQPTVVALVWSNVPLSQTTDWCCAVQQSPDLISWTAVGPWWFHETHSTVQLVTNSVPTMFYRLVSTFSNVSSTLGDQGTTAVQQFFSGELASTKNVVVFKTEL